MTGLRVSGPGTTVVPDCRPDARRSSKDLCKLLDTTARVVGISLSSVVETGPFLHVGDSCPTDVGRTSGRESLLHRQTIGWVWMGGLFILKGSTSRKLNYPPGRK